ncbi:MAG: hypothetical protein J2P48_08325 [Alphaproteobacteria bacterium]|nr:hypothetical protein [Alphaproteobacteria bacterium]
MKTPRLPLSQRRGSSVKAKIPRSPVITVNVTKEIFEASKQADSSHCMIASALKAAFPGAKGVSVDLQTIRFSDPDKRLRYIYLTPRLAQIGIIDFDQGHEVEPFSFRLAGGHVINMFGQKPTDLSGTKIDPRAGAPTPTKVAFRGKRAREVTTHARRQATLAKQGLRPGDGKTSVPERVGGRSPPRTPFSRRRAFGLRAIQK